MSAIAAVVVLAAVFALGADPDTGGIPVGDASWLTDPGQASCVEQYSARALANRDWAFEGVITAVHAPASSETQAGSTTGSTTTVRFRVTRWFWGGSGDEASRETYAIASSAGVLDASVGAEVLAAGDAEFLWPCGFTQAASSDGRATFEDAAARRAEA